MCGIAGLHRSQRQPDLAQVEAELGSRGPNGSDSTEWRTSAGSHGVFVHTRLAINDLSPAARQPMSDETNRYLMVFNGEIYNSPELRTLCESRGHRFSSHMDGEVILHLFEDEGTAAFARLNGIFAVAILDRLAGDVVLARDPLGVKPLFYALDPDGGLYFASELRALAATGAPMGDYDLTAMAQFLTFLWVPSPRTPFTGAWSLGPGECLRHNASGYCVARYCDPLVPTGQTPRVTERDAIRTGRELFSQAAQRQLLSDVPIGLMASGGIDSGLLWWATGDSLAQAFTIAWPTTGPEGLNEDLEGVRRMQGVFGTPVQEIEGNDLSLAGLPQAGDLFADPAFALTRAIAKQARELGVPVLLSGQGGDELFGGYRRHQIASLIDRVRLGRAGDMLARSLSRLRTDSTRIEYAARTARAMSERDPFRGYMQLCTYSTAEERARTLECTTSEVSDDVVWQEHQRTYDSLPPSLSFTRKAMTLDLAVYLPGLGLAYVDRAGMEHGTEIRVPWLDLELVRWSLELPIDLLHKGGSSKWLTRQIASQVLPQKTANAPKRGFGAPSTKIAQTHEGARGFRQGSYYARAAAILKEHRNTVGKELLSLGPPANFGPDSGS